MNYYNIVKNTGCENNAYSIINDFQDLISENINTFKKCIIF